MIPVPSHPPCLQERIPGGEGLIVPHKLNAESYRRILRVVEVLDFVEFGANDGDS